jgi:hypothetical protein
MDWTWLQAIGLAGVALLAGIVDAIAGGGGLLTVPALMLAGLPTHLALGTNKAQSICGTVVALGRFARAGRISGARARWMGPLGFLGALGGTFLVLHVEPAVLTPAVMVLLAAAGVVMALVKPRERDEAGSVRVLPAALLALLIGAYDGFFGPGTGTFLIVAFTSLLGLTLPSASAEAKVVNFASNLAALLVFAGKGGVAWSVALPMAAGQVAGGWVGAHLTLKRGAGLVRGVLLMVVAALLVKLGWTLRGA